MSSHKIMNKYIGISEERLKHISSVARKCYQIAKSEGQDENFCKKMWMIGWNHDVGYEFAETHQQHPLIGSEMLSELGLSKQGNAYKAIRYHGLYYPDKIADEWRILNIAGMSIDNKGNDVGVIKRLEGIKKRYGEHSDVYLTACDVCVKIGLIDANSIVRDQFGG